ncbi:MAG: hypothetical protein AB7E79_00330 [Rhodospirillaceae bacterium]
MLSVTQFEVYVFDHGRWTIHARYGSDQRKAAVMDARTTEFSTALPTKVVAETYFPEIDESELVTVYVSPKARELREAAKIRRSGRTPMTARPAAPIAPSVRPRRLRLRPGFNLRQFLMQAAVAGGFSLVAATISTVLISWGLKRSIDAGLPVSASLSTTILTYAYAVFFLFFFMSLFRSKLPLHRLLSALWAQSAAKPEETEETTRSIAAAIAPKLRPKQPPEIAQAEAARARDELKILRGDVQPELEPGIVVEAPTPVITADPAPPVEIWNEQEKKRREKKRKEAEQKAAAAAVQAATQAAANATAEATVTAAKAAQPVDQPPADMVPLERAVLRRFISEVVKPAAADTMPDDPVTRRGVSLVIAGAAAALADTAKTSPELRLALVEDALSFFGVSEASAAMFVHQHDELIASPSNASLVNLGRSALAKHLEGADVARILATAIAGWRTPFGQPAAAAAAGEPPSSTIAAPGHAPQDTYLLTELRIGPAYALTPHDAQDNAAEAARDAAMGLHNSVVRSVLGTHAGHEVKHTGAGIFAQFKDPGAAIGAASEIQRRFTASYGPKLAVALIASTGTHDDPALTPNLVRQAQTAAAQACDGEVLAERRVQRAAALHDEPGDGDEDDDSLVKISSEPDTEAPALYEHEPVRELTASPP